MNADAVRYEPSTEAIEREPRGYPFLRKENEALLRDTLAAAGVELGEWDDLILRWLANWEFGTVAVVASWVTRASRSQSASAVDEPFLGASASPQARSPERDGTIGTPAVSPGNVKSFGDFPEYPLDLWHLNTMTENYPMFSRRFQFTNWLSVRMKIEIFDIPLLLIASAADVHWLFRF